MGKRLGEVAERFAVHAGFLAEQAQVIRVARASSRRSAGPDRAGSGPTPPALVSASTSQNVHMLNVPSPPASPSENCLRL